LRGATRWSLTVSGAAGGGGGTSTNTHAASQANRSGSSGNPRAGCRIRLEGAATPRVAEHRRGSSSSPGLGGECSYPNRLHVESVNRLPGAVKRCLSGTLPEVGRALRPSIRARVRSTLPPRRVDKRSFCRLKRVTSRTRARRRA
jgi:hypothetical protein